MPAPRASRQTRSSDSAAEGLTLFSAGGRISIRVTGRQGAPQPVASPAGTGRRVRTPGQSRPSSLGRGRAPLPVACLPHVGAEATLGACE